jgi:hypothetical protein
MVSVTVWLQCLSEKEAALNAFLVTESGEFPIAGAKNGHEGEQDVILSTMKVVSI